MLPQILTGVDPRIVTQFRKLVEAQGITFHTGRKVETVDYRKASLTAHLDDGTAVDADLLLVSVGRRPETRGIGLEEAGVVVTERGYVEVDEQLRTANPKIWSAGDCIGGLQLAHLASAEAARAVENALGHHVMAMDRTVVPSCIYTHPEIAMVGLNSETAKAAGYEVKVGQARFLGNGKALGEGEPDGIAQLYADATTGLLLGATVMGVHAVEIIHEVGVAISDGLTMDELGAIIHAHPTVSETIMDAPSRAPGSLRTCRSVRAAVGHGTSVLLQGFAAVASLRTRHWRAPLLGAADSAGPLCRARRYPSGQSSLRSRWSRRRRRRIATSRRASMASRTVSTAKNDAEREQDAAEPARAEHCAWWSRRRGTARWRRRSRWPPGGGTAARPPRVRRGRAVPPPGCAAVG